MQERMPISLTDDQKRVFHEFISSLVNYESEDPDEPIDPLSYVDSCGDNCLHIAAFRGNGEVVRILIDTGLDVNSAGDKGSTPLHYAAMNGHLDIVKELLLHGSAIGSINQFGHTPVNSAELEGHTVVVNFLRGQNLGGKLNSHGQSSQT